MINKGILTEFKLIKTNYFLEFEEMFKLCKKKINIKKSNMNSCLKMFNSLYYC